MTIILYKLVFVRILNYLQSCTLSINFFLRIIKYYFEKCLKSGNRVLMSWFVNCLFLILLFLCKETRLENSLLILFLKKVAAVVTAPNRPSGRHWNLIKISNRVKIEMTLAIPFTSWIYSIVLSRLRTVFIKALAAVCTKIHPLDP